MTAIVHGADQAGLGVGAEFLMQSPQSQTTDGVGTQTISRVNARGVPGEALLFITKGMQKPLHNVLQVGWRQTG
jgi:hypothetical protein